MYYAHIAIKDISSSLAPLYSFNNIANRIRKIYESSMIYTFTRAHNIAMRTAVYKREMKRDKNGELHFDRNI